MPQKLARYLSRKNIRELQPEQWQALDSLLSGNNVFLQLPTGSGKSLSFEVPAACWNWKTLVVSPLVALMEDQNARMRALGVESVCWHSGLSPEKRRQERDAFWRGTWRIALLSPERLLLLLNQERFHTFLKNDPLKLLVLDELHCFFEWTRFRAAYGELLARLDDESLFAGALRLGLSATTELSKVGTLFPDSRPLRLIKKSFLRKNLHLFVKPLETDGERYLQALSFLRGLKEGKSAILYCPTRRETEALHDFLQAAGLAPALFHAGLPASIRLQRVEDFQQGRLPVVCASSAFGMGIDAPHVERVIHFGLPYGPSDYWQAAGRAGRDGSPAYSLLLWSRSDACRLRGADAEQQKKQRRLWEILLGETCRQQALAAHFGMSEEGCGCCDVCWRKNPFPLPDFFLPEEKWRGKAWWTRVEAETLSWIDTKIFREQLFSKNLDGTREHDSV